MNENRLVNIETKFGNILIWLHDVTPLHKNNFLKLTKEDFYDSVIFHRVIDDFMIQTGDPTGAGNGGPGYTIPAEMVDSFKHNYGTVATARLGDAVNPERESSGSQFYIVENSSGAHHLDGKYTIFGKVVDGMAAVESIAAVPTNSSNRPLENVYMINVDTITYTAYKLRIDFGFIVIE